MLYGVAMERGATAEQREAFGHELERRLMGLNRAEFARKVAIEEGRDRPHPEQQVSAWIKGENIASQARVFAIERALDATPGALSHLLGYLPVEARDITTVEDAISFAAGLDDKDRSMLIELYQSLRER